MATIKFILIIFEVLLLFNLLIGVHELGHFLAAKWRGLKIDRFAIWFGKPIWKKKIGGVEYALGWIPAGGYVALPQMATMEAIEGKSESTEKPLPPISALDKIIVAFAGPLFSFLLAVAFAVIVWQIGRPMNSEDNSTTIGWVIPKDAQGNPGPAWQAGLRPGDKILEIDGHRVTQFPPPSQDSIMWRIITSEGTNIVVKYERNGEDHVASITPYHKPTHWYERKALRQILIAPVVNPIIAQPLSNSPAARAGLHFGDKIVAVDGQPVISAHAVEDVEEQMTNGPVHPVTFTVQRDSKQFETTITPEKPLQPAAFGPSFGLVWLESTNVTLQHPTPAQQIHDSAMQIVNTLGALFRKNDVGVQQLGGAVMIVRVYTKLFTSDYGWQQVIWFSVVLNVNLAMLNLLPFPVLDGGHIVLALLEVVRRRPVSAKVLQAIQTGCAILLIFFMLFIAFFDTGDWIRNARADREQPIVFAPKN